MQFSFHSVNTLHQGSECFLSVLSDYGDIGEVISCRDDAGTVVEPHTQNPGDLFHILSYIR
jgi:hypothetical protein